MFFVTFLQINQINNCLICETLTNQGVVVFIMLVLLSDEVKKCWSGVNKTGFSEFSQMSMGPSSFNLVLVRVCKGTLYPLLS